MKSDVSNSSQELLSDTRKSDVEPSEPKRSLMKRKLEESFDDNATLTSENNTSANEEPVKKKGNYFKSPPKKVDKDSRFMKTLTRISEKESPRRSKRSSQKQNQQFEDQRATRSSAQSIINAAGSKKLKGNNVINETLDGDETIASMYEDAVAKPMPIMNSTMNPNSAAALGKALNVTVLIEPLKRAINNETITIEKKLSKDPNLTEEPKSQNSTLKEVETVVKPSGFKIQKNGLIIDPKIRLQQFDELITDDESSPERKHYKSQKGKQQTQPKRVTRSQNSSISDVDEIKKTPPSKIFPSREFKASLAKSGYKQPALFSPY